MIRGLHINFQKVRFYNSVVVLNAATLFFIAYIFQPFGMMRPARTTTVRAQPYVPVVAKETMKVPVTGKPIRVEVIQPDNGLHVDLPVKEGFYNETDQSWTLNQSDAFFAMLSTLANDTQGTTFIYGHNEANVFGHLSALRQGKGAYALVHTDSGKVFRYSYRDATNVTPDDASVFSTNGPPTLVLQTCSGKWFELRRMYYFSFEKVEA